jgi:hypothetical protein
VSQLHVSAALSAGQECRYLFSMKLAGRYGLFGLPVQCTKPSFVYCLVRTLKMPSVNEMP